MRFIPCLRRSLENGTGQHKLQNTCHQKWKNFTKLAKHGKEEPKGKNHGSNSQSPAKFPLGLGTASHQRGRVQFARN